MSNNIVLSLGEEYSNSNISVLVFDEELKKVNNKYPLGENQVDIQSIYFVKNADSLEVSFFIRNGLCKNIALENIILAVENDKNETLAIKEFNFKSNGLIPPFSARPYNVEFPFNYEVSLEVLETYTIKFGEASNLNAFSSVSTNVENMPIDIPFEEEKAIKDFVAGLKTLEANQFHMALYKLNYLDEGGLDCTILFRNGANHEVEVQRLPISVIDENEKVIACGVFLDEQSVLKIGPMQAIIQTYRFAPSQVTSRVSDLSKCNIIYK